MTSHPSVLYDRVGYDVTSVSVVWQGRVWRHIRQCCILLRSVMNYLWSEGTIPLWHTQLKWTWLAIVSNSTGDHCSVAVDHCASNPCQGEGSVCVSADDEYLCHCSPGHSGPDCSISDRDMCGTELCYAEGGKCVWNGTTSYVCTCKPGWTGEPCQQL